ncbi:hypothetical protein JA1_001795 [Spathaspora sp. JA1]|nr:hypothetical protein JA1_001795 [Spathaspora sp. JA1]
MNNHNEEAQETVEESLGIESLGEEIENYISPLDSTISPTIEDDPDPLQLRKLALSYDYLIYKIKDHISNLSEITYNSIQTKQNLINQDYLVNQLQLSNQFQQIDQMLIEYYQN